MTTPLPPRPRTPPTHEGILLREFRDTDLALPLELLADRYVALVGSLPAQATEEPAREWIARQRRRWDEGVGFFFAVADARTDRAVGHVNLELKALDQGRASAGYFVAPGERGRGIAAAALTAVTGYVWTIPEVHRIELLIEPWNAASLRTAENAGYQREGLLRSYMEIGGRRRDMVLYAAVRQG